MDACCRARLLLLLCWLAVCACAERRIVGGGGGGSLRGALEALQRRQRARADRPHSLLHYHASEPKDYEELYELYGPPPPPQYDDEQYGVDDDALEEALPPNYIKYLEEEPPRNYYEYKIKKKSHPEAEAPVHNQAKQSAFRERALNHNADNDRLKELFTDRAEEENKKEKAEAQLENDVEYAVLLDQLWSKYKNRHPNYVEAPPEGIVKLYKERTIKKREYPTEMLQNTWGPVAFKKKRSPPEQDDEDEADSDADDYPALEYPLRPDDRLKYSTDDDDDSQSSFGRDALPAEADKDMRDEYAIAFQPLESDKIDLSSDGDDYSYAVVKRFPVTKRSSGPYEPTQKKRSANNEHRSEKKFRAGAGTDPKVVRDLSKIFGEQGDEQIKSPVKRSNKNEENSHETKPPQITASQHNASHDHNTTHIHGDGSHEHQGHNVHVQHPPVLTGKEEIVEEIVQTTEKDHPILLKKKSIDWSQYFGIDRRKKSILFRNDADGNYRNQYLETFNHEMGFPPISRVHNKVKRDFVINKPVDESEFEIDRASAIAVRSEEKRNVNQLDEPKLDSIDRKLKGVESVILDEALHMSSNVGGDIDSKEQQELKEKMLSRLAAAYSLEKMRKALDELKQSMYTQRSSKDAKVRPMVDIDETKKKRIAVKKEKAELKHDDVLSSKATHRENRVNDEFEGEQGAGHYLNGGTDEPFSEGYMGGSGRHHAPAKYRGSTSGNCPVLERIVQRCRGIDMLAGDQGQLFLPLCSLHQICYLCGQSAPTTCDLIFLSEADTACEGDTACGQAARGSLMAMRELHESLVDDLDGECEASPCLASALRRNLNWSQAVKR